MAKVKKSAWLMLEVDGKVLMLKRGPKANNPNLWNFPGGNIDPGETAIQGVIRESFEEAGIKVKPDQLKFITALTVKNRALAYYRVKMDDFPKVKINNESSKYEWVPKKKIKNKKLHKATEMFVKIKKVYL